MAPDRSQYVQYGSHTVGPPTWLNYDASPTLRAQRVPVIGAVVRDRLPEGRPRFPPTVEYGDVVRGLPVSPGQCRAVYCSHVLEHLALEECRVALRHTFSYLAPGGCFRFVMPDLRALTEAYLAHDAPDAAHRFMRRAWLGEETRPRSLGRRLAATLGNAAHRWMWDFDSMRAELEAHGFERVRRAEVGDAEDPRFDDVEDADRWSEPGFGDGGRVRCLGVECFRPGP